MQAVFVIALYCN